MGVTKNGVLVFMNFDCLEVWMKNIFDFKMKRSSIYVCQGLLAGAILSVGVSAWSNDRSEIKTLKKDIDILEEKVRRLQRGQGSQAGETISDIEMQLQDISEQTGSRPLVHAFDSIKLDIGGFLHTAYTYVDGENASEGSFNRQNFELLIGSELTDNWSAFIASGFLREANDPFAVGGRQTPDFDTNNRNPLIIGWANYRHTDFLNIRIGRMITPHGIINIEHFPATLLDPEQPQFLRPFGGNTIFPNFSTGVQLHGRVFGEQMMFEYASYAVNAPGVGHPDSNTREIVGFRAAIGSNSGSWKLGFNGSDSYRGTTQSSNTLSGIDLHTQFGFFELKTELYETEEERGGNREAFYVQPILHVHPKVDLFYRYDSLDAGDSMGVSEENAVGLNILPSPTVRLRLVYTAKNFEGGFSDGNNLIPQKNAEANLVQVSGTFSF